MWHRPIPNKARITIYVQNTLHAQSRSIQEVDSQCRLSKIISLSTQRLELPDKSRMVESALH